MVAIAFLILFLISCGRSQPITLSVGERIYGLSRIWKDTSDMYSYWELLPEDFSWDEAYHQAVNQAETVLTTYEYYTLLERLGAKLEDGHVNVVSRDGSFRGMLPIRLKYIEGRYVVTATEDPGEIPLYSTLIGIDGSPVSQHLQFYIEPLIGLQTPLAREQRLAERLCLGERAKAVRLNLLSPAGETLNLQKRYTVPGDLVLAPVYAREPGSAYHSDVYDVDLLEEHIAHIRIYTLGKDAMVKEFYRPIIPLLGDAQSVILDIRQNAGGNSQNGDQILEAFASQPLPELQQKYQVKSAYEMSKARLISQIETMKQWGCDSGVLTELQEHPMIKRGRAMLEGRYTISTASSDPYRQLLMEYWQGEDAQTGEAFADAPGILADKPCVLLIGHESGSAVDDMAAVAKAAQIPLIGTRTKGATGSTVITPLPNQWYFTFSSNQTLTPCGGQIQNVGVEADVYVEQTYDDLVKDVDTQLEKALEYLKGSLRVSAYG